MTAQRTFVYVSSLVVVVIAWSSEWAKMKITATLLHLALVLGITPAQTTDTPRCSTDAFESALPPSAKVISAVAVADGGSYHEGRGNLGYPSPATDLPTLCAFIVQATSSSTSSYRFGLFLPDEWIFTAERLIRTGCRVGSATSRCLGCSTSEGRLTMLRGTLLERGRMPTCLLHQRARDRRIRTRSAL